MKDTDAIMVNHLRAAKNILLRRRRFSLVLVLVPLLESVLGIPIRAMCSKRLKALMPLKWSSDPMGVSNEVSTYTGYKDVMTELSRLLTVAAGVDIHKIHSIGVDCKPFEPLFKCSCTVVHHSDKGCL